MWYNSGQAMGSTTAHPYHSAMGVAKMTKRILTQERLKEVLHYEPSSGIFTWRVTYQNTKAGDIAGCITSEGYWEIRADGRLYLSHRLAWLYMYGAFPKGQIDHIDGNPANNAIDNLRDVSQSLNQRNARKKRNNTSGITGVSWHKTSRKWRANIRTGGKQVHLGLFTCKYRAASMVHLARELDGNYTARHGCG